MQKKWMYAGVIVLAIIGAVTVYETMQTDSVPSEVIGLGTQKIEETQPTADDLLQAKQAVQQTLESWNQKEIKTFESLVYNVHPLPYPPHFFEQHSKAWQPMRFKVGTPYVLHNWTTPSVAIKNPLDSHDPDSYKQNLIFTYAIGVPVQIEGESTVTHYHCVKDKEGRWRVAYSFLQGFEIADKPEDY